MKSFWTWWCNRPLIIHLVGVGLLVQGLALGVIYLGQSRLITASVAELAKGHAAHTTPLLASALASAMAQRDYASLQAIVDESTSPDGISSIAVFDSTGRRITREAPAGNLGASLLDVSVPLALAGQSLGRADIRFSRRTVEVIEEHLFWRRFWMALLALSVVVVGFSALAYYLILPIKRLTSASRTLGTGVPMTDSAIVMGSEILTLQRTFEDASRSIHEHMAAIETARQTAEKASQAKSEFLSKVSHELRTPLNGVMGMLELMKDSGLSAEQRELADISYRSGESLLLVINDILDLSNIGAGKLQIERQPFALRATISATAKLFETGAARKGVALTVELAEEVPIYAQGDVLRFRQMLANLIGNAVKFTERGAVGVTALVEKDGRELLLHVSDTGVGIDKQALSTIFEPFIQADNSNTRRYGGIGLGLTIVKSLAEAMGGSIEVSSVPALGSLFSLRLPLFAIPPREGYTSAGSGALVSFDKLRVLLVEDNEINQVVAEHMLRKFGCVHKTTQNGKEALAALTQERFDLVLMDCQMPVMDGFAATVEIRAREQRAGIDHIPIIALTANAASSDRDQCLACGMDDYLAKPYTEAALNAVMAKYAAPSLQEQKVT